MTQIYRIGHRRFQLHNTEGASRAGGRWHGRGEPVLYFASSLALAVLELRAKNVRFEEIRRDYHFIRVELDLGAGACERAPTDIFKTGWTQSRSQTQAFGSVWISETRSLVLEVRSAVLPPEANFVINTLHPGFKALRFPAPQDIPLDPRLK